MTVTAQRRVWRMSLADANGRAVDNDRRRTMGIAEMLAPCSAAARHVCRHVRVSFCDLSLTGLARASLTILRVCTSSYVLTRTQAGGSAWRVRGREPFRGFPADESRGGLTTERLKALQGSPFQE